ncbi:hypothetical protein FLA4_11140 [Candidatus Rickettsia kotlanii]|nr:hypothetical protein FLA4_11140 [Candidatus Rickettsia kotlanii]BDU61946.1 hypothetical protein HM2_11140 [Candidatus Rickettsia kotlanii]
MTIFYLKYSVKQKYEYQEMTGFDAGKSFEHYVFLELIAYKYLNDKRDE